MNKRSISLCLIVLFSLIFFSASSVFASSGPDIFVQTGHTSAVKFVDVNSKTRYMVSLEKGLAFNSGHYLKIWDFSAGREIKTLNLKKNEEITNIQFIDENRFIVFYRSIAEIYDIQGQISGSLNIPKNINPVSISQSKNGKYFFNHATRTKIYKLKDGLEVFLPGMENYNLFDVLTGGLADLGNGLYGIFAINRSANYNYNYTIYDDSLDVRRKGTMAFDNIPDKIKISPDMKYLACQGVYASEDINVYNLGTGQKVLNYKPRMKPSKGLQAHKERRALTMAEMAQPEDILFFDFVPDGRLRIDYLRSEGYESTQIEMVMITMQKNGIYSEETLVKGSIEPMTKFAQSRPYVITDKGIVVGFADGSIKLLDINTGAEIRSFGVKPAVLSNAYSVGHRILNWSENHSVSQRKKSLTFNLWDLNEPALKMINVKTETALYEKPIKIGDYKSTAWFSTDPEGLYRYIPPDFLYDNYREHDRYGGGQGMFFIIKDDGSYNAKPDNYKLELTDKITKKKLADLYGFDNGEWVIITPEGYFNASPNGAKYLSVRIGNGIFSIDQFYTQFYRPDMVQLALAGGELPKAKEGFADIAARSPAPTVEILKPASGESYDRESANIKIKLTDNGGGIGNIAVYLNGSQVANETRGIVVKGRESKKERLLDFDISLVDGKNDIRVIAFNRDGSMESSPASLTLFSKAVSAKPALHALIIGINQYKNESISLKYAESDAKEFAETLKKTSSPLFGSINVTLLTSRDETSKDNIKKSFEQIRAKIKPNDVFVFYNASHGIIDIIDDQEQYYLLTSNVLFLSSKHIGKDALSQKDLAVMIGSIPAQKKLIILDTCHAGRAGKEITVALLQQTRGLTETTAVKLLQRAIGATVFSASSDTQQAFEGYKGHGLFTYVLNEGLRGKADVKKDGFITINSLGEYVEEEVVRLSKEVFNRQQTPTIQIGVNFPVSNVN